MLDMLHVQAIFHTIAHAAEDDNRKNDKWVDKSVLKLSLGVFPAP